MSRSEYLKKMWERHKDVDDVPSPFRPSARGHHRVQHNRSIVVKRNPVVRKDSVGRVKLFLVFDDDHFDARAFHPVFQNVELHAGPAFDLAAVRVRDLPLK